MSILNAFIWLHSDRHSRSTACGVCWESRGSLELASDRSGQALVARKKNTVSDTQGFLFRKEARTPIYAASLDFENSSKSNYSASQLATSMLESSSYRVGEKDEVRLVLQEKLHHFWMIIFGSKMQRSLPGLQEEERNQFAEKDLDNFNQTVQWIVTYVCSCVPQTPMVFFSIKQEEQKEIEKKNEKVKLLTESLAFGLALIFSKVSHTFLCPDRAARCRGVRRFWERERKDFATDETASFKFAMEVRG